MLFVLAWFLWLHKQQDKHNYDDEKGGDEVIREYNVEFNRVNNDQSKHDTQFEIVDENIITLDINEDELHDFEHLEYPVNDDDVITATVINQDLTHPIIDDDIITATAINQDLTHLLSDDDDAITATAINQYLTHPIIDDDIITATTINEVERYDFDLENEGINFTETNLQNEEQQIRQAKLFSQASFKRSKVEDLNVSNRSDDYLEHDDVKQATLLKQQSFKKDRGEVKTFQRSPGSPFHNFSPINTATNLDYSNENVNDSIDKPLVDQDDMSNIHNISDLNMIIDGKEAHTTNYVSCVENDVIAAPVKFMLNSNEMESSTLEDDEVEAVFKSEKLIDLSKEEEDMQYTTRNGVRVRINAEPAGRIHSIVVKNGNPTKIRYKSPRTVRTVSPTIIRAVSPRMHVSSKPQVHMQQQNKHSDEEMVHLVVNTHKLDVHTDSIIQSNGHTLPVKNNEQNMSPKIPISPSKPNAKSPPPIAKKSKPVRKEIVEEIMPVEHESVVESGNPDFSFDDDIEQKKNKNKQDVGKLQKRDSKKKAPTQLEQHTAEPTDFDAVMKRRKKMVDTMDDAGRLLGQIAHREQKISGARNLSKNWTKVKEAVRTKKYLLFKDKPMKKLPLK